MNSNASDRSGSSLERPQAAGKPVDPATRLSELLAQSLDELTRPFDPPKPGAPIPPQRTAPVVAPPIRAVPVEAVAPPRAEPVADHEETAVPAETKESSEEARRDADRALAELEAELFAAAKQVDREQAEATGETVEEPVVHGNDNGPVDLDKAPRLVADVPDEHTDPAGPFDVMTAMRPAPAPTEAEPVADPAAANVIAKVRRLMLVSMAITLVAVGSVFGLVGYRMFKADGAAAKTADKVPEKSAIPTDITLSIPRNARVVQSAVANERLVMTLEIDGKLEVRTFDVKTLQPVGRLNFSATP